MGAAKLGGAGDGGAMVRASAADGMPAGLSCVAMSSLGQRRSTITFAAHTCAASTTTKSTANVIQMMMNMAPAG
jgi:hypothetical protein